MKGLEMTNYNDMIGCVGIFYNNNGVGMRMGVLEAVKVNDFGFNEFHNKYDRDPWLNFKPLKQEDLTFYEIPEIRIGDVYSNIAGHLFVITKISDAVFIMFQDGSCDREELEYIKNHCNYQCHYDDWTDGFKSIRKDK